MQKSKKKVGAQGAVKSKKGGKKGTKVSAAVPAARPSKGTGDLGGGITLNHREFVANVSGTSASFLLLGQSASVPGYDINPGCSTMFPWLSQIATAYEKYRFEAISFEVVPRNPTTLGGAVYAAIDYDWDDVPPTTTGQIMANRGAVSSDVWTPVTVYVDCARLNQDLPYRYVVSSAKVEQSQRQVYGGYFMVGIAGAAAAVSFDIYVQYTLKLSLPALHTLDESGLVQTGEMIISAGTPTPIPIIPKLPALTNVVVGVDCPNAVGYASLNNAKGYKLPASATGTLVSYLDIATAGAPPSAYAADTSFDYFGLDRLGNVLSTNVGLYLGGNAIYEGVKNVAQWATNGADGRVYSSLALEAVRKLFPDIAYLIPRAYSVAGRTTLSGTTMSTRFFEL